MLIESNEKAVVEITKGYDENALSFKDISTQRIVSVEWQDQLETILEKILVNEDIFSHNR